MERDDNSTMPGTNTDRVFVQQLQTHLTWLTTLHLPSAFLSRKVISPGKLPKPHSAKKRPCIDNDSPVNLTSLVSDTAMQLIAPAECASMLS